MIKTKDEILNQVQDDRIENSNGIAALPQQ
jgi:hypothetical protein